MGDHFPSGDVSSGSQNGELNDAATIFTDDEEEGEEEEDYIAYLRELGDEELRNEVDSEGENYKRRRIEAGKACSSGDEGSEENEWSSSEIDGLSCPICMEHWTSDGDHHICCLPCGHIFGMSCIRRWLKQRKNQGKCPQCNGKCTLKDVRKLFASQVAAVEEESQKRIQSLQKKCASLEKKRADWSKKEANWRNIEAELRLEVKQLRERTTYLEGLLGDLPKGSSRSVNAGGESQGKSATGQKLYPIFRTQASSCRFVLQEELQLHGAHLFDVDASNQILLFARSLPGMAANNILTKMSLVPPYEREDILLPQSTKFIKDLHFSPSGDGLALFSSLGKKLSLLSSESNNVVLVYDLPAAAWSCSWDLNGSHHMYAGLQNGSVVMFDMRQTTGPVKFLKGLTSNPVHTVHSLPHNSTLPSGRGTVLSASSAGLCQWNFEGADERQGIMGSHVQYKRTGTGCFQKLSSTYACLDQIRLPKCAVIDIQKGKKLFASREEGACELTLQELPSFSVFQHLKSEGYPLRDIKYTHALNKGLLSCLSGDVLQIFTT